MAEKRENYAFPHSSEAERAVLGAILRHPDSFSQVVEKVQLQGEHFFLENHRQIFEVMAHLDSAGRPIDYFTISEALTKLQVPPNLPFLIELVESSPVTENIEHYAGTVKEKYYLRRIIRVCEDASLQARTGSSDAKEFLGEVEKEFLKIVNEHEREQVGLLSVKQVLPFTLDELEKRKTAGGKITGVSSGFTDLDRVTSGWQKSDLIILAARPGMGKTALALNWGLNAVKAHPNAHVAIFTLEMSKEQLVERLLSAEGKIDSTRLRSGDLGEDDMDRVLYAARMINNVGDRLAIDETPTN